MGGWSTTASAMGGSSRSRAAVIAAPISWLVMEPSDRAQGVHSILTGTLIAQKLGEHAADRCRWRQELAGGLQNPDHDLADMLVGLQPSARGGNLVEREGAVDDRPEPAVAQCRQQVAAFIFSFFLSWPLLASSRHQDGNNPYPARPLMRIPLYQVDAFTSRLFGGNPAAVCPLAEWLPDAAMQAIAAENNLAETAFFVARGEGYLLRWFTPTVEVDLCGHATLASGYVVTHILTPEKRLVTFDTLKAGPLEVRRDGELLAMDFPSWPPEPSPADARLLAALGKPPKQSFVARGRNMFVYERAEDVAALRPDFATMRQVPGADAIVTAPGEGDIDFVSRYFAPNHGIDEDPATGSSHCVLTPYWAGRLGKQRLRAQQISARVGDLVCTLHGDRITLGGHAVLYLEGTITV